MDYLSLWVDSADKKSEKIIIESDIAGYWLKAKLLAQFDLPSIGPNGEQINYRIFNSRTGKEIPGDSALISKMAADGDHIRIRSVIVPSQTVEPVRPLSATAATAGQSQQDPQPDRDQSASPAFSITGISPQYLDFISEYPILAIRFIFCDVSLLGSGARCSRDPFFLIADRESRFRWVSWKDSFLYRPELKNMLPEHNRKMRVLYSVFNEEKSKMIYPVRQFSITGIEMEGFDPARGYPVLAMETERVFQEPSETEEAENQGPGSRKEVSMAFFLVGDDNGEFAWIAEDECRLYPLN